MKKKNDGLRLLGVLALGIIIGVIVDKFAIKDSVLEPVSGDIHSTDNRFLLGSDKYWIETFGKNCPDAGYKGNDEPSCDQRIVKEGAKTGSREIVIPSIKTKIPALNNRWNHLVWVFAEPFVISEPSQVILASGLSGTDANISGLYVFSKESGELSTIDRGSCLSTAGRPDELSPDQMRIACVSGKDGGLYQKISILTLLTGKITDVVTLSGRESLNGKPEEFGGKIEVQWINNETILYGVFDHGFSGSEKPLIGYRTKTIK